MRALVLLLALLAAVPGVRADEAAAWTALREGRGIALMRHADAPGGAGDPPGFRLGDCATQRNLSEQGRRDAQAVGDKLRREHARIGKLLSSPWCRCMDTASLMKLGLEPQAEPTFGNVVVLSDRRTELTEGARRLISAWKGPGSLLVVTHGANIVALLGGPNPGQGEIVVVEMGTDGRPNEIGRLPLSRP